MDDEKWFPRFAEIPGINYETPKNLEFAYLPGRGKTPEISYYDFDGKRRQSIMWKYGDIRSGASPAREWKTVSREGESEASKLVRQIYEILELPGTLSDYHFALQRTHDDLNGFIGREAWILTEIEKLCLLNARLLDTHPETISYENDQGIHYFRVTALNKLIKLYETEGYLHDALEIAQIAVKFGYGDEVVDELENKIKLLEEEDNHV